MADHPMRVLVVDDDANVSEVVATYLQRAGFTVDRAPDGATAIGLTLLNEPDLVLLDLTLPDIDGLDVCRRLREHRPDLPVVVLTARSDVDDRIIGLQTGADDYVTKPFSPRELVLRVQTVLRRTNPLPDARSAADALIDGDLELNRMAHRATLRGADLTLTVREFDLLAHFLGHPGQAFTREDLMRSVWGWEHGDQTTVTVHVRRLREKVERDPSKPQRLVTVWGVGYRWDPDGT